MKREMGLEVHLAAVVLLTSTFTATFKASSDCGVSARRHDYAGNKQTFCQVSKDLRFGKKKPTGPSFCHLVCQRRDEPTAQPGLVG